MGIDNIPGPQVFRQRDVRRTATASVTVAQQLSPIGSIVAWAKTLAGVPALPAGWVQCDGAVLSDPDSLLDGTTIPDLNGGIFLEGQATSGATGGSATMAHTHTSAAHAHNLFGVATSLATDGANFAAADLDAGQATDSATPGATGAASNDENRPPFYTVVWIMRIK